MKTIRMGCGKATVIFETPELELKLGAMLVDVRPNGDARHIINVVTLEPTTQRAPDEVELRSPEFSMRWSPTRRCAVVWFDGEIQGWQLPTPLRHLVAWMIDAEEGVLMHASAVNIATKNRVAVFSGPSGRGKSTLSARCQQRNRDGFLGDDWIPIWRGTSGRWYATALYQSLKLSSEMVSRLNLSEYASHIDHPDKMVLDFVPADASRDYVVGAVFVPKILDSGISVKRIDPFDAIRAMAPSSILPSPGLSERAFSRIGELVNSVPCYELAVGLDMLPSAPMLVEELT